jgi:hypothetical protein
MKRLLALLVVTLVLFGTLAPTSAWAGGRWHGYHHHHHWWPGAVIGGLAVGVVAAATYPLWARRTYVETVYVPQPVYVAPPPVYQPVVYQPPAPPPVQREVVYPHGRHVLYGDGITQPWQWVWIAAAPPPPPPPAPPAPAPPTQ